MSFATHFYRFDMPRWLMVKWSYNILQIATVSHCQAKNEPSEILINRHIGRLSKKEWWDKRTYKEKKDVIQGPIEEIEVREHWYRYDLKGKKGQTHIKTWWGQSNDQCNQIIGNFWKFFCKKSFLLKWCKYLTTFWALFKIMTLYVKTVVASFWATFENFGQLFIPT